MLLKCEGLALANSVIMMWHSVWSQSVSGKRGRNESWKPHFSSVLYLDSIRFSCLRSKKRLTHVPTFQFIM